MPEFEENKPNPDLHKESNQYQPSKAKPIQESSQEATPHVAHSNMRGRWKRPPSRGPVRPVVNKEQKEDHFNLPKEPVAKEEPVFTKQEPVSRPSLQRKSQATTSRETARKEVFIPKTKQESERHKTRYPAMAAKKPGLWQKILAFFGLVVRKKKPHSEQKRTRSDVSSHGPRSSSQKRRYSPKQHSGPRGHSPRSPRQGPKSSN